MASSQEKGVTSSSQSTSDARAKLVEAARLQNEREAKLCQLLGSGDAQGLRLVGGSISKVTFTDAVRENMEVFGHSKEQAVQEAIKEFRLMGIDVSSYAQDALNEIE